MNKSQQFRKKKKKHRDKNRDDAELDEVELGKIKGLNDDDSYEHPCDYNMNNLGLSITIRDLYDEFGGDIRIILPVILAKRFKNYIGQTRGNYGIDGNPTNPNNEHFSGNYIMRQSIKQIYKKYIDPEKTQLNTDLPDTAKQNVAKLMLEYEADDSLV